MALELGAAASSVALGFVVGFVAGFMAFASIGSVFPAWAGAPTSPVWDGLVSAVLLVVVLLGPVFLGGFLAAWIMGLAIDGQARGPRWRSAAGGWAAVALVPLLWLPSAHAIQLLAPLLVLVAALPWLLLTMPPGRRGDGPA